jgi:hypothetical protein
MSGTFKSVESYQLVRLNVISADPAFCCGVLDFAMCDRPEHRTKAKNQGFNGFLDGCPDTWHCRAPLPNHSWLIQPYYFCQRNQLFQGLLSTEPDKLDKIS